MNDSPPGSFVHGLLQARILDEFPCPPPGDPPNPGTEAESPALAGGLFTTEPSGKPQLFNNIPRCFECDKGSLHTHPSSVLCWSGLLSSTQNTLPGLGGMLELLETASLLSESTQHPVLLCNHCLGKVLMV